MRQDPGSHGRRSNGERIVGRPASLFALFVGLIVVGGIGPGRSGVAEAKVFASQKQALAEAFPDASRIDRRTLLLRAEDVEKIEALTGQSVEAKVVVLHVAYQNDQNQPGQDQKERIAGFAEIAVHTVRTQPEALLIVLDPNGQVRSVRIIAFHEPLDYLPTQRWYGQFVGKRQGVPLRLGREIHGVVGATLSAQAAVDGVRRMLAYWEVLLRPAYGSGEAP